MIARMAAAIVALVALAGLVVQFAATLDQTGSVAGTLWTLLRYFTVLTNLLVALAFGWVAIGGRPHPRRLAGVMLAILLVGIVYGLLLRGLLTLSGGALLADTLLHKVTPVLVPLWWIAFEVRGQLRWRDPWGWALFPALYLPYALLRGMAEARLGDIFTRLKTHLPLIAHVAIQGMGGGGGGMKQIRRGLPAVGSLGSLAYVLHSIR